MATETDKASIDAVAQMLMGGQEPTPSDDNIEQVANDLVLDTPGAEPEPEELDAEAEYVADDLDSDVEEIEVEDDELTSNEPDAYLELSDDMELEVKSNGEMKKVTLAELKRGYAGQDYIQKGMEENANTRKSLDQDAMSVQQDRERLDQLIGQLQQGTAPRMPERPSRELQDSDPVGYLEAMENYRSDVEAYNKFQTDVKEQLEKKQQQEFEQQQRYTAEQAELLKKEIPELADPEKGKKLVEDIRTVAVSHYGVPEEILGSLVHGWEFKIMRDAVAYQKLQQSKKTKVEAKSKRARPHAKPGAKKSQGQTQVRQRQQAEAKMRKTGSIKDVGKYLLS